MNNVVKRKPIIKYNNNNEEWVEEVVKKINENGGKDSLHVIELPNLECLQLLKQKGWYQHPTFKDRNKGLTVWLISTDISPSKITWTKFKF